MFYFLSLSLHTSKKKKKKNATREERIHISKSKPARHNTASFLSLSLWRFGASFLPRRRLRRRRSFVVGENWEKTNTYMTPPENNESRCSSVVLMDILKRAHAHVVDAVRADENEYLESAVRSYALAMDYFKTYLKMSEIEKKKYGE